MRFIPNRFIKPQILASPELQVAMETLGNEGLKMAQADAPVDTGTLRASLRVEAAPGGGRRIVAGADYATFVEFGTSDTPMQPFLRPLLSKLGLRRTS